MNSLYFFLTIVNRSEEQEFISFFERYDVNNVYSTPAVGTASDSVLDLLGLAKSEKTVHLSLLPEGQMRRIIKKLTTEMLIDVPGRGIALAIPLSSIAGRDALNYFSRPDAEEEDTMSEMQKEKDAMTQNTELIVVILEKGNTDLVMDAARGAGARGGTVLRAKGTGSQFTDTKFFGLSIAEEKEIIYIVSTTEKKGEIMKAIMAQAGSATPAHAVVFALPVTETAGLRLTDIDE